MKVKLKSQKNKWLHFLFFKTVNDGKWKLQWNLILLIIKVKLNKLGRRVKNKMHNHHLPKYS